MLATVKPLFALTAADLMSHPPVLVPRGMSLEGAAHMLRQAHITGAPVVDEDGRCVGVVSATDFVHLADRRQSPGAGVLLGASEVCTPWTIVEAEEEGVGLAEVMTHDPVLVPADANIGELARMMIDAHIHRVVVADAEQRPLGVVSSTDILAALARDYQVRGLAAEGGPVGLPEPVDPEGLVFE